MIPSKGNILVKFDPVPTVAGLVMPERYKIQEGDETEATAYGVHTNRKLINPQVITILSGGHSGRRAFVYYGAYEIAKWPEPELAIIPETTILFFVDPILPVAGTYLGEEVFSDGERTASGIYITPYAEKKEGVMIKITHVPQQDAIVYNGKAIQPGDTVVTVDAFQYDLTYCGHKHIKLNKKEIIGVKTDSGYIPVGDKVLLEYLPDPELSRRIAENDKRRETLEIASKYHLHIGDMPNGELPSHLSRVKEPKTTEAKILAVSDSVSQNGLSRDQEVMVLRNYGCMLPNGQWITGIDNVVGILTCQQG